MKKLLISMIFCYFVITDMYAQHGPPICNDFVTLNGKNFECGGQLYYPLAVNYSFQAAYHCDSLFKTNYSTTFLSRSYSYGPCGDCFTGCGYESCDSAGARQEILNDLCVLHHKGFNAIRNTFGFEWDTNNSGDTMSMIVFKCCWDTVAKRMYITTAPNDTGRIKMFRFFEQILEMAHEDSIKVFLDIGYGHTLNSASLDTYLVLLRQFAQYVHQLDITLQQTLIAYVIVEEAHLEQSKFKKSEICSKIRQIYDTLKMYDPAHLVAVGGLRVDDVFMWDPGVMKIDFWCPHFYPYHTAYENANSDAAVERIKCELYWLKDNCPMPWMVGETGFGATDDDLGWQDTINNFWPFAWDCGHLEFPQVHGELAIPRDTEIYTQITYADSVLKWVRDCGGAGYTNWDLQEEWITAADSNLLDVNGNCMGLLRHGEAISDTINNGSTIFKPVIDTVFRKYLDVNGQPPPEGPIQRPWNYYNMYNGAYHTVIDTVMDQDGNPIKDAYVLGQIGSPKYYIFYTFTKNNPLGIFVLKSSRLGPDGQFAHISVSYPGANVSETSSPYDSIHNHYILNLNGFKFDETYSGTINGYHIPIQGWSTLTINDPTTIDSTGIIDFRARNEIHVNPEFEAKTGSEVHIYCMETFTDCGFVINKSVNNYVENIKTDDKEKNKEIEIDFVKKKDAFSIKIIPNPCTGTFNLSISIKELAGCKVEISDLLGNNILKRVLNSYTLDFDLSNYGRGIYFLKVYNDKEVQTEKIIFQ